MEKPTSNHSYLQVLPQSAADIGTYRCRLGPHDLDEASLKIGSCAWVRLSSHTPRSLVTIWPREDGCSGYINISRFVLEGQVLNPNLDLREYRTISLKDDIEPVNVIIIKQATVTVVLKSYKDVLGSKRQDHRNCDCDLCMKIELSLRQLYLSRNCTVICEQLKTASVLGVHRIFVHDLKLGKNAQNSCGKFLDSSKLIIKKFISLERFQQKGQLQNSKHSTKLGGLNAELNTLKDLVRLSDLATNSAIKPSNGILLQGPPGCGKSSVVQQLAKETDSFLLICHGPELFGSRPGETESNLRELFQKAQEMSLEGRCILFLDEVDAVCPVRGSASSGADRRVVSQMMGLLDQVTIVRRLTVIGATNNPGSLDLCIRRPGRLEKEILIGIPTLAKRCDILRQLSLGLPLSPDLDLTHVAECTPGFVGADLKLLIQQAHQSAVMEAQPTETSRVEVTMEHIRKALHNITPSTQRGSDVLVDYKPICWDDIGGLEEVKVKLKQAVEWPLKHADAFIRLGIPRPKGILLYGPPGCAKTTLVRAAATSCHVTFLAVNGGQLYSPYVGDSERKLTQIFRQARAGAPSILFIDELDSVIGSRNKDGGSGKGVQERVLSTLLNEMDGIGIKTDDITKSHDKMAEGDASQTKTKAKAPVTVDNSDILVIAATNRPDMIDDAVLRPGRIDRILYIPPPDQKAREEILKVYTRHMPVCEVDLQDLADRTEGYTGADLENLCREAALHALSVDGLDISAVTSDHFLSVLSTLRPSVSAQQLEQYTNLQQNLSLRSS